jgi:uncharacterized protein YbaA (DUF1428 family)
MRYVDGFVIPIPKKNLNAYVRMAKKACKIWREYGALEYRECVGDDLRVKMNQPFPRLAKAKSGETVVFSWIVYKSRAHRQGDEGPAHYRDVRCELDAVRLETDGVRRLQGPGPCLARCALILA